MPKPKEMKGVKAPKDWDAVEDIIMAYRYMYYVQNFPVISDTDYDKLEKSHINSKAFDKKKSPVGRVGSSNKDCYPKSVRYLATYMGIKHQIRHKPKQKKKGLLK